MNLGFLEILVQPPLHTQAGFAPPVTMLCYPCAHRDPHTTAHTFALAPTTYPNPSGHMTCRIRPRILTLDNLDLPASVLLQTTRVTI